MLVGKFFLKNPKKYPDFDFKPSKKIPKFSQLQQPDPREGRLPNNGRYGCAGPGIGISGINFCPGIRFLAIFAKSVTFHTYQAFYSLKHYNLLKTGSFLIRKLNQSTSCLILQFKDKYT